MDIPVPSDLVFLEQTMDWSRNHGRFNGMQVDYPLNRPGQLKTAGQGRRKAKP